MVRARTGDAPGCEARLINAIHFVSSSLHARLRLTLNTARQWSARPVCPRASCPSLFIHSTPSQPFYASASQPKLHERRPLRTFRSAVTAFPLLFLDALFPHSLPLQLSLCSLLARSAVPSWPSPSASTLSRLKALLLSPFRTSTIPSARSHQRGCLLSGPLAAIVGSDHHCIPSNSRILVLQSRTIPPYDPLESRP